MTSLHLTTVEYVNATPVGNTLSRVSLCHCIRVSLGHNSLMHARSHSHDNSGTDWK